MKIIIVFILIVSNCSFAYSSSELEKLFVGKYRFEYDLKTYGTVLGYSAYSKDHTYKSVAIIDIPEKVISVVTSGFWRISDGYLSTEVKESSNPDFIPLGFNIRVKIVEIDETGYFFKMPDGEIFKEEKINKINHITYKEKPKTDYEEKVNDSALNSFSNNIDYDLFGKYHKKYNEFMELYEKRETKKLKEIGDFLLNNGYGKDRFILSVYAAEAYSRDDYEDSAKFLKAAIKGDYPSELIKPTVRLILIEDAQLYYGAHIVYKEMKENEKSKIAYEKAVQLFKDFAEDEYSKEYLERVIEMSTASLNHYKAKEITKEQRIN